jgi:chromosome partitioning protein
MASKPAKKQDNQAISSDKSGENLERRPLPRVIAFANQKGGVGKTTTTITVGASLAELGYRVLIIDLDPQGNASTGLGVNSRDLDATIYDVLLRDEKLENCVEPTFIKNLFVAPSNLDLAGADIELVSEMGREQRLKKAIETIIDQYDYILLDCPPSLGLLTVNGLTAATEVFVPIQCEYFALEGLGQLLRSVDRVSQVLNPILEVTHIACVMYTHTTLSDDVVREVREHFGDKVCKAVVPRSVRVAEAPSHGKPITVFDPTSAAAKAYREIAKEISGGTSNRAG